MVAHRDGRGRLFSRQVQDSQCNGFLHEGCLCWAQELWQGLWAGEDEARAQSSSRHHEPGQTGPEGRAGLPTSWPSAEALRQVEGVDPLSCLHRQPEASSSRLLGCMPLCLYRKSGSAVPPFECQALFLGNRSLPVHVGIPWYQLGLLGTGLFCSFSSVLVSHGPYRLVGPLPGSGFERREQPLRERVLSCRAALPQMQGASRAHNK